MGRLRQPMSNASVGYTHCAHVHCFAIIIGKDGDLCDDCKECNSDPNASYCEGCDLD